MPARGHVEKLETEYDLKHLGTNFSFVPLEQIKTSLLLPGFKLPFVPKFDEEKRLLGKFLKYCTLKIRNQLITDRNTDLQRFLSVTDSTTSGIVSFQIFCSKECNQFQPILTVCEQSC